MLLMGGKKKKKKTGMGQEGVAKEEDAKSWRNSDLFQQARWVSEIYAKESCGQITQGAM